jgi:predicted Zn-dependent peptidase
VEPLRGEHRVELNYTAETAVVIGWQTPGRNHADEDALTLMSALMDNNQTGILNLSVTKAQRAKTAGAASILLNEAGAWFAVAEPKAGQSLEEAQAVLLAAVAQLKAGAFTDDDLKAVITDLEVQEKSRLEENSDRVELMRKSYIQGEEWAHASRRLEWLRRVTRADILRVANQYLGEDRVVVFRRQGEHEAAKVSKPKLTPVSIDPSRHSRAFQELSALPTRSLAPRSLRRGRDYRILSRSWGKLYWAPNPANDLFKLELRFDLGRNTDGRLPLALKLLGLSGAGELTLAELEKKLYGLGAAMWFDVTDSECIVSLLGPENNFDEVLRLALLRLGRPNIAPGVFRQMLAIEQGAREDRKTDADAIKDALRRFALFGSESPVLKEPSGEQLASIRETDLKALLGSLLGLRREALYSGRTPAAQVAAILSARQGRRAFHQPPPRRPEKFAAPRRNRVIFVHHPGMTQALIGAFAADGAYDPAAQADALVYDQLMGGGMGSVYFQELRESRALAYDANGGYLPGTRIGDGNRSAAAAGTQADKAAQTLKLLSRLMRAPPLTEDRARAAIRQTEEELRNHAIGFRQVPEQVLSWMRRGVNKDPRPGLLRQARSYGLERLRTFVSRFKKKPVTFYIVGDRDRIDLEAIKKIGDFKELSLSEIFPF